MDILVIKDSATKVPKQVETLDEARQFVATGFEVHVIVDGASVPLEAYAASQVQDQQTDLAVDDPVQQLAPAGAAGDEVTTPSGDEATTAA